MSVSFQPQGQLTLANLLQPMQFKTVLLVACGLKTPKSRGFSVLRNRWSRTRLRMFMSVPVAGTAANWCGDTSVKVAAAAAASPAGFFPGHGRSAAAATAAGYKYPGSAR